VVSPVLRNRRRIQPGLVILAVIAFIHFNQLRILNYELRMKRQANRNSSFVIRNSVQFSSVHGADSTGFRRARAAPPPNLTPAWTTQARSVDMPSSRHINHKS